jgi:hypothetical protein
MACGCLYCSRRSEPPRFLISFLVVEKLVLRLKLLRWTVCKNLHDFLNQMRSDRISAYGLARLLYGFVCSLTWLEFEMF